MLNDVVKNMSMRRSILSHSWSRYSNPHFEDFDDNCLHVNFHPNATRNLQFFQFAIFGGSLVF